MHARRQLGAGSGMTLNGGPMRKMKNPHHSTSRSDTAIRNVGKDECDCLLPPAPRETCQAPRTSCMTTGCGVPPMSGSARTIRRQGLRMRNSLPVSAGPDELETRRLAPVTRAAPPAQ